MSAWGLDMLEQHAFCSFSRHEQNGTAPWNTVYSHRIPLGKASSSPGRDATSCPFLRISHCSTKRFQLKAGTESLPGWMKLRLARMAL